MKRLSVIFSFILLNLSFYTFSQNYPIPAQNSQWGQVAFLGPPSSSGAGSYVSIYKYEGKDTVINEQTYQFWQGVYTRYIDNKLIMIDPYHSKPDSIIEVVYYDFNLTLNDSFLLPIPNHSIYAIVHEVNNFNALNGQIRKEITLQLNDFTCTSHLKWIEGIGDISNGVFYLDQLGLCDIYNRIVCFSDSSGFVYKELNFNYPCDSLDNYIQLSTKVREGIIIEPGITIYPNPVTDKLIIKSECEFKTIRVLDMNSSVLIESNNKLIECSHLKKGGYLLELTENNKTTEVLKFIKK